MPELREVFEMTTKQMEPDVDSWRDQEKRQRRSSRNKKVGAFAVAAAIGLGAVVFVLVNGSDPTTNRPAVEPTTGPRTSVPAVPYSLELATGEMTPLPDEIVGGAVSLYSVSPDGTQLAYNDCCSPPNDVSVANVDGTDVRQVNPDPLDAYLGSWSPDGSKLVYQQRNGNGFGLGNLVVVDLATGQQTQVTDLEPASNGWWYMNPSFSADGQSVLFHIPRGPDDQVQTRWDLWSVPVDGGEPSLVIHDASMGAYAPDGETLAYLDSPRGYWASSRLMLDDGDPRVLVEGDELDRPQWSPDGTMIAYSDGGVVSVVDVATGETTPVAQGEKPAWLDDDTLIVVP